MASVNKSSGVLSTALIILISFAIGAIVMYGVSLLLMKQQSTEMVVEKKMMENSSFFDAENAHVMATVADFNDSTITLSNVKNQSETFTLSPQVFVSKPGQQKKAATASGQMSALEKEKQATINFSKKNGTYEVVSVLYTPTTIPMAR